MNIKKQSSKDKMEREDPVGKVTGFFLFRNVIEDYGNDKNTPEDDRKSVNKYGKISLTLSIIALVISAACIISNLTNLDFFGFSYVLMLVIYIFSGIIISIVFSIYGFVFGVMQVRLNRKSSGIIGLILSLISLISSVFLIIILIT